MRISEKWILPEENRPELKYRSFYNDADDGTIEEEAESDRVIVLSGDAELGCAYYNEYRLKGETETRSVFRGCWFRVENRESGTVNSAVEDTVLDNIYAWQPMPEVYMNKEALHTEKAPAAIGPYSQGIKAGETIYVSGQLPIDPATGKFAGEDVAAQTRQSLANIREILKAAGADMSNVVKTTVLLKDIADFTAMNEVYAEFFSEPYPARAAFQVAAIPKDARVEIEAVAVL